MCINTSVSSVSRQWKIQSPPAHLVWVNRIPQTPKQFVVLFNWDRKASWAWLKPGTEKYLLENCMRPQYICLKASTRPPALQYKGSPLWPLRCRAFPDSWSFPPEATLQGLIYQRDSIFWNKESQSQDCGTTWIRTTWGGLAGALAPRYPKYLSWDKGQAQSPRYLRHTKVCNPYFKGMSSSTRMKKNIRQE